MTRSAIIALLAVAAVAVLALLLRRTSDTPSATGLALPPTDADEADALGMDGDEATPEIAAVTSDGWSFVPFGDRDQVRLLPPRDAGEGDPAMGRATVEQLGRGDLIAVRVKRGAPDHDPWRLEGLGRDQEYRAWRFETEDAARAALDLVARRVVRLPRGEDGEPVAVGDADFEAARRRDDEIEAELASMTDADETPGERYDGPGR